MKIKDSVFLVTGAGSGLGAGTARMLVAQGGKVLLVDRNPELGEALAQELGASAAFTQADVTSEEEAAKAVSVALSHFGKLNALINSVVVVPAEKMIGRDGPHRLESFSRTVRVNLVGTFNMLRLVAAELVHNTPDDDGERGVIINTASVAAFEGQIGQAGFAASMAGIVGLTLPVARELAQSGVRVMSIAPGMMETTMMSNLPAEVQTSLGKVVPFPARLGKAQEFAALVCHIVQNSYLNGEVIRLDGALRMSAR
ncbi:MAG: SDR family NAD(P)-dependent oxidoreductase [Rhodocyclaceae bacterium]|nr:SDR family NAD(P)-dependent oxidoreductase [Rhodocyclaceae bacterium]